MEGALHLRRHVFEFLELEVVAFDFLLPIHGGGDWLLLDVRLHLRLFVEDFNRLRQESGLSLDEVSKQCNISLFEIC